MYDKKDKGERESTDQNIFEAALTNCKMYERKPSNLKANFHSSQPPLSVPHNHRNLRSVLCIIEN